MPAYKEEVEEAEHEGVRLEMLAAPVEITLEERQSDRRKVPSHGAWRI